MRFVFATLSKPRVLLSEKADKGNRKMVNIASYKLKPVEIGGFVLLNVPQVDQGPVDYQNVMGRFLIQEILCIKFKQGVA